MILVVFYHVCVYTLGIVHEASTPFLIICQAFRMPTFFFVSGYIAYKSLNFWTPQNTSARLLTKAKVQLIPTFVFWSVYYLFVRHVKFPDGYWFTLVLFEMFLIYFSVSRICNFFKKDFSVAILLIIVIGFINARVVLSQYTFYRTAAIGELITYFSFFVFGIICRKYQQSFERLISKNGIIAFLIVYTTAYFYVMYNPSVIGLQRISSTFTRIALGLPLIVIFYNLFYQSREYWAKDSGISRLLQFVGRRTLDIYMIHYFFILPAIPSLSDIFAANNNDALVLIVGGTLTFAVLAFTLLFSYILRTSRVFRVWLFGVKE